MHDFDDRGQRIDTKYRNRKIDSEYLNQYLIRDFERTFRDIGFQCETRAVPFGSKYASWTSMFLRVPMLREFLAGYVWFVLAKPT